MVLHYHVRAHLERSAQGPGAGAQHGPSKDSVTKVQRRYEFVRALLLAVAYLNSPLAAARLVEQQYIGVSMREETKSKQPEQI